MTDAAAGLSPDLLPGDARALYDSLAAVGMAPVISEVRYSDGTIHRSIEDYLGYPTGANGDLLLPARFLWNYMTHDERITVLKVMFVDELSPAQLETAANKTWSAIKPEGRPRLWRALLSFMRDESATLEGVV
jgi:hypothetical protein